MVMAPRNTFFSSASWPAGTPVPSDPYQFSGEALRIADSACPEPFGSHSGSTFCPATCVNTCPDLNPSPVAAAVEKLAATTTLVNYLAPAITNADAAVAQAMAPVTINGAVSFPMPEGMTLAAAKAVMTLIQTNLPLGLGYSISFKVWFLSCV